MHQPGGRMMSQGDRGPLVNPDSPPRELTQRDARYWTKRKQDREKINRLKYLMFAFNLTIFVMGMVVLGVGIWMAVERSFMTYIIGSALYSVAIYMVLIGGGLVFFISFLGCTGAITENRCMILTFCGVLCFLALMLFLGAIIGIAFSAQIGEAVQNSMEDTLKDHYGVDLHKLLNWQVTDAWDRAQEKLFCCGVRSEGWKIYSETKWFERYGAQDDSETGIRLGSDDQRPYVPQSCCVKDRFWRYVNIEICQKWRLGPPGAPVDGAINRALYYDGCFDNGLGYLKENTAVMIGLGICLAALLGLGIFMSIFLLKYTKAFREEHKNVPR